MRRRPPPKARKRAGVEPPIASAAPVDPERVQKVLARVGLGSRRAIEGWISAGRVRINDRVAALGDRVAGGDRIFVDEQLVGVPPPDATQGAVLGLHKPAGYVCTREDPQHRPTVFELLPKPAAGRWVGIGRLDYATSGLLLFTTDGELAHRLMHPRFEIERIYAVRVRGALSEAALSRLRTGVELDDGPARFDEIIEAGGEASNHWYHVRLHEGRHHEVRRLIESQGHAVSRLLRIKYGPISLPSSVRAGRWWLLSGAELNALRAAVGLTSTTTATLHLPGARKPRPERRPRPR